MFNSYRVFLIQLFILITLIQSASPSEAGPADISNWSYDELRQKGFEVSNKGNYKNALRFFDAAVHACPNDPEAYINRGAMFELLHETNKAIQDELRAIALANGSMKKDIENRCFAHQNLAGIYLDNNQLAKAEAEARIALKLCCDDPIAQEKLGDILFKRGKSAEGYDFSKWKYADFAQVAQEYLADHNYRAALKYFNMAVKSDPTNPEGYVNRGSTYELLNQSNEALQDEQIALKLALDNSKDTQTNRCFAHLTGC